MPDSVGDYDTKGKYNSKDYAEETGSNFFIWWDGIDSWIISTVLGVTGVDYHKRTNPSIIGVYSPEGAATGDATVAEGYTV